MAGRKNVTIMPPSIFHVAIREGRRGNGRFIIGEIWGASTVFSGSAPGESPRLSSAAAIFLKFFTSGYSGFIEWVHYSDIPGMARFARRLFPLPALLLLLFAGPMTAQDKLPPPPNLLPRLEEDAVPFPSPEFEQALQKLKTEREALESA